MHTGYRLLVNEQDVQGNNLLNALQKADRQALLPYIHEVLLLENHILHEPADDIRHVYFPRYRALASHIVPMADGTAIEAARVGNEGMVEGMVARGNVPAYARVCVTHGGQFYQISASVLQDFTERSAHMNDVFARHADCMMAQLLQSIACNATHTIEERAASWLCAAVDRTGSADISLTQDRLGTLLGVGRTYVSRVVGRMKGHRIIDTRRGGIKVIDRDLLDRSSCDCRHLVAAHYKLVLKGVVPAPAAR